MRSPFWSSWADGDQRLSKAIDCSMSSSQYFQPTRDRGYVCLDGRFGGDGGIDQQRPRSSIACAQVHSISIPVRMRRFGCAFQGFEASCSPAVSKLPVPPPKHQTGKPDQTFRPSLSFALLPPRQSLSARRISLAQSCATSASPRLLPPSL